MAQYKIDMQLNLIDDIVGLDNLKGNLSLHFMYSNDFSHFFGNSLKILIHIVVIFCNQYCNYLYIMYRAEVYD